DLPMEEGLAMSGITTLEVSHMMAFPDHGRGIKFIKAVFVDSMSSRDRRRFWLIYHYILKKVSWMKGGRQLCLKSPDNTARIGFLKRAYPRAKFINIYRNPYVVVRSAVHMFSTEMSKFAISEPCSDEYLLDHICQLFEVVYRRAFRELDWIPEKDKVDIKYEDFVVDQEAYMQRIYEKLGLDGYEKAAPYFKEYIDSMQDYKTNTYEYSPELIRKVNERMGFYFERYGYEMIEPGEEVR
ncbi:MAG: sulfotransferase, partial [Lachnospiraceae bacterium]|nr:sulfotransferase [Lachnospiraceae bacterium]